MMERHLAEELRLERQEQHLIATYNAMQYIAMAMRYMSRLPLYEETVEANMLLAQAHSRLSNFLQGLTPKPAPDGKPKGRGRIIDLEVIPEPFSNNIAALTTTLGG